MDGETTSRGGVMRFVPGMWTQWASFVRAPQLPEEREPFGGRALVEVGQLLALTIAVDLALVGVLGWLSTLWGIKTPEFTELTQYGAVVTLLAGALGLPILEEIVFRGWLKGRRRMLVAALMMVVLVVALMLAKRLAGATPYPSMAVVLVVWLVLFALLMWWGKGPTPDWFRRVFPLAYFGSAILFGLAHISNYDLARPLLLLPFVLPQTIAGLIFGFARVRYGMWANIALHGLSNALFLGLTLSGM